jgi:REP element-mobilizing transposase RayT
MARRPRVHVPGGFYHVTLRGNHQQRIFFADTDRLLLNEIVARALEQLESRLHAYCWMDNHIHMLVEVGESPLGCLMRQIASGFARRMQRNLGTTGHFFERRYHAKLVAVETYLKVAVRYIHMNPVTAGMVRDPRDYPWSSHRHYLNGGGSWITTDFVLGMFGSTRSRAVAAYDQFLADEPIVDWESIVAGTSGSSDELDLDLRLMRERPFKPMAPRQSLDELIGEACRLFMIASNRLDSPVRDPVISKVRAWIALQARERGIATLSDVARRLNRTEATLRQAMREWPSSKRAG